LQSIVPEYNNNLDWNKEVIDNYVILMHLYYITAEEQSDINSSYAVNDLLWPLDVLDFERSAIAALHGRTGYNKEHTKERTYLSKGLSVCSDAINGAMIGAQFGGGIGAVIGAEVGTRIGIAKIMIEEGRYDQLLPTFLLPSPFSMFRL